MNLQEVCGYVDLVGVYEVRRCVTEYALHKHLFAFNCFCIIYKQKVMSHGEY